MTIKERAKELEKLIVQLIADAKEADESFTVKVDKGGFLVDFEENWDNEDNEDKELPKITVARPARAWYSSSVECALTGY